MTLLIIGVVLGLILQTIVSYSYETFGPMLRARRQRRLDALVNREIQRREMVAAFEAGHEEWMMEGTRSRSIVW